MTSEHLFAYHVGMEHRGRERGLTERQERILRFITSHIQKHRVPPTVREIGAEFRIGPAGVFDHLKALERKGRIRRMDRGSRAIDVVGGPSKARGVPVPIVGRVAAGQPILADQRVDGHLIVEEDLARGATLFALQVKGRSMIGAGILDGDYVVARQQQTADDGDIVVALIGDEATVKRLRRRGVVWRLEPENPEYQAVPLTEHDALIQGKVIAVHRRIP